MRKTLCATALVALALLGAGCKKASPIVGKWTGAMQGAAAASGASATYEFKDDKTMSIVTQQGPANLTISGTYALDGENLTINFKDVTASGVPKEAAAYVDLMKKGLVAKPINAKLKVVSDDSLSLSGEGGKNSTTLTRVKA